MSEEQEIFRGSPSMLVVSGSLFVSALLLIGAGVGAVMYSPWLWILAGVILVYAIIRWVLVKSRVYEITTERIRTRTGIVTKKTEELELYRVKDTTLIEPLFLRMFGAGTIRVTTGDATNPYLELEAVHGARTLREALRKHIEECRDKKRVRLTEFEQGTGG